MRGDPLRSRSRVFSLCLNACEKIADRAKKRFRLLDVAQVRAFGEDHRF